MPAHPGAAGGPGRELLRGLAGGAGRWAVQRAQAGAADGLAAVREVAAARRDPERKHAKRMRRARRKLGVRSVAAGGLAALTATVGAVPGLELGEIAWGGATAVAALGAVSAGLRLAELRRMPAPPARPRPLPWASRPPKDSPARRALDRLGERERALGGLLGHLGPAGDDAQLVARDAAAALRSLGTRLTAVDRARRGAQAASAAGLDGTVAALVRRLDAGVSAYDQLVVAAAEAVAAQATLHAGDPVLLLRLEEATDSLAGLAAGLHDVAGR